MSKKSIFGNKSQPASDCFDRAETPKGVLVVPVDLAKEEHVAAICLGTGQYLCKPFRVFNGPDGVDYLLKRIDGLRRQRGVRPENILVGGEDPDAYTFNFIHALRSRGHFFLRVNAGKAAVLRNNSRAASDVLALDGIAQALIQRRGRPMEEPDPVYAALKTAARSRRRLVAEETAWKNRIHRNVDVLFPGFLNEANTGLIPFSEASCDLMKKDFSCVRIKRMQPAALLRRLRKHHLHKPEAAVEKIKRLAARVLPPSPEILRCETRNLAVKIQMLGSVRAALAMESNEMARALVRTPGFFLTSIPGIGVVLAAHIVAEYGPPEHWPHPDNMASYAGIVPRQKQTGGVAKPPIIGRLPHDANRILKDYLLQAAFHVGVTGDNRFTEHYRTIEARGGRSRLGTAKLLLRISRAMARTETVFFPRWVLRPGADEQPRSRLIDYCTEMILSLERKWRRFDLDGIPPERHNLERCKETLHELINMLSGKK